MLETVGVCIFFGLVIGFWAPLLVMIGYGLFSTGCDDFRKDVVSIIILLFEKGYCVEQVFDILKFYCDS